MCPRARGPSESLNPAARGGESPGGRVAVCGVPGAGLGALQIRTRNNLVSSELSTFEGDLYYTKGTLDWAKA